MLPRFSTVPPQQQQDTDDMCCQSDDESGIIRALAMSAPDHEKGRATNARMSEALKLRQKMHPSGRRTLPVLSPRHTPSMFDDDEEEHGEAGEQGEQGREEVVKEGENVEPNRRDRCVKRGGGSRRGHLGGRRALMARLNIKNDSDTPQKEEKGRMTSSQFQNQLSSRFKTTKHQVRKLASSDTEE